MSKKTMSNYSYTRGERRAEREIDAYLKVINGASANSVLEDLRSLAG